MTARRPGQAHISRRRGGIVTPDQLCQILGSSASDSTDSYNVGHVFDHPNEDVQLALLEQTRVKAFAQSQLQNLLQHDRFLQWMNSGDSDLILVDANISSAALETLSATSVFCATLLTGIVHVRDDAVVTCFFCGLHISSRDSWYSPSGVVRSLIVQHLMELIRAKSLDLSFIDSREYRYRLSCHDLDSLCDTLWALVSQVSRKKTIYVILDSVSWFDEETTSKEMETIVKWFFEIINDGRIGSTFKVMMTSPNQSTEGMWRAIQGEDDTSSFISLTSSNIMSTELSSDIVEGHILQPSMLTLPKHRYSSRSLSSTYQEREERGWYAE